MIAPHCFYARLLFRLFLAHDLFPKTGFRFSGSC
jgi:hypothetical protein